MPTTNVKSHCNTCGGDTEQIVLHEESSSWTDDEDGHEEGTAYQMIKCAGCGTISMRSVSWHSEFTDEYGAPTEFIGYFPPRAFRKIPAWHADLQTHLPAEKTIHELLGEIYVALQNDLRSWPPWELGPS